MWRVLKKNIVEGVERQFFDRRVIKYSHSTLTEEKE